MVTDNFKIVVTTKEVNIDKLKTVGTVLQYEGDDTMPRDLLLKWSKEADAIFCLLRDKIDKDLLDNCNHSSILPPVLEHFQPRPEGECPSAAYYILLCIKVSHPRF